MDILNIDSREITTQGVFSELMATPKLPGACLAKFYALRGRRIISACGAFWYSVPNRFLMSLPYQQPLDPKFDEIQALIHISGAIGLRFQSRDWPGIAGGVYVFQGRDYGLDSVHVKHRPRVRKGLQTFEIRPVEASDLLNQGIQLNRDTMLRQGHYDREFGEVDQWARFVRGMCDCPDISAIGAYDGKRLCACMITCREDGWINILHQMSRQDALKFFPNHVLTYSITKAASEDASLEGISYGLVPLISIEGLDEYKLRFGYQVIPYNNVIILHPGFNLLLNNRFARWGVERLRQLRPDNQRIEMTDTILRGAMVTSEGTIEERA